ncbi:MAG: CPBP family intramembrane metalloprotease [Anaerolineales bacterium]|nr:CPBP family intramembrane metalloprotease [Anaerolineales bacterium]
MFSNLSDLKKAGFFYALVMVLTTSVCLLFRLLAPDSELVVLVHNLTPVLATILMVYIFTRDGYLKDGRFSLGLRRAGWRYWGLALLLPLLVLGVSYGLAWISGAVRLVMPTESGWLRTLSLDLSIGLLVTTLFALSEEIGFRGYMLPRTLNLGTTRALILSGFLFASYHLPVILLTPFFMNEGSRLLTIPIFLLVLTAAGVIYGALRLAADSIWPSTIMHGVSNSFLGIVGSMTMLSSPAAIYLVGESGMITLVITTAVALWMLRRRDTAVQRIPALDQS